MPTLAAAMHKTTRQISRFGRGGITGWPAREGNPDRSRILLSTAVLFYQFDLMV